MSRRSLVTTVVAVAAALAAAVALTFVAVSQDDDASSAPPGSSTTTSTVAGRPGAPGLGDPYFPGLGNGGYDVAHYDLALAWQADDGVLAGRAAIEATATQDLSSFNLDLSGLQVRQVTVDGHPAEVHHEGRELQVVPAAVLPAGERFTAVVAYRGTPRPVSDGTDLFEVGWHIDGREAFVVSEPTGAATFFPANDHPSDKATYTLHVTAPDDQVVAANGLLVGRTDAAGDRTTWTYRAAEPMASYLVQVAIGDYVLDGAGTAGGVVLRHAFHRKLLEPARTTTGRTAEMIDLLDDVWGPYPFEAYGVLVVDESLGFALETQTLTILGSDLVRPGADSERILVHELAHQWVGNAVSPATWKDIWLNEGFASYSEWLWIERTGGATAAELARERAASGSPALDQPPGDPGSAELFGPTVYWRGAMALQALREAIGDEAFFTLLRRWVADHSGGVASTADLLALAEEVSGQQLDALFAAWLYAPRLPDLD